MSAMYVVFQKVGENDWRVVGEITAAAWAAGTKEPCAGDQRRDRARAVHERGVRRSAAQRMAQRPRQLMETDAWNAAAHDWAHRIREGMGGRVHLHDASIYELLPPPSGLTLDVGCGEGRLTRELSGRGYDVVGVDASTALVDEARAADPARAVRGGADRRAAVRRRRGRSSSSASTFSRTSTTSHGAAVEFARVLAPGAAFVIGTIHPVAQAGTHDEETGELRITDYWDREREAVRARRAHGASRAADDRGLLDDAARRGVRARCSARGSRPVGEAAALPRPAAHASSMSRLPARTLGTVPVVRSSDNAGTRRLSAGRRLLEGHVAVPAAVRPRRRPSVALQPRKDRGDSPHGSSCRQGRNESGLSAGLRLFGGHVAVRSQAESSSTSVALPPW